MHYTAANAVSSNQSTTDEVKFQNDSVPNYNVSADHEDRQKFYITTYTTLILITIFLNIFRSIFFFYLTMRASKSLHNTMFRNILEATMRFFDTNPSGKATTIAAFRFFNRFSCRSNLKQIFKRHRRRRRTPTKGAFRLPASNAGRPRHPSYGLYSNSLADCTNLSCNVHVPFR